MTWGEFKEKMQQRGVTDCTPIGFIDISADTDVDVDFRADGSVWITDERDD